MSSQGSSANTRGAVWATSSRLSQSGGSHLGTSDNHDVKSNDSRGPDQSKEMSDGRYKFDPPGSDGGKSFQKANDLTLASTRPVTNKPAIPAKRQASDIGSSSPSEHSNKRRFAGSG